MAGLAGMLVYKVEPYVRDYNVEPGERAPEFDLTNENGVGIRLSDYRGRFVLLNFWATWCPPCVEEMPSLNRLYERFRDDGLVVLGISVDEEGQAYERFLEMADVQFPTARDPERKVSARYGTSRYPETYLIGPEGEVIRKYVGAEDWERPEIVNYLRSLLSQRASL